MKIAVFGGSGMIGRRIVKEALSRGHEVTVVVRNPENVDIAHDRLKVEKGDATRRDDIARLAAGKACIISALKSEPGGTDVADVASNFAAVLPSVGVKRLIVVAGAGMLEAAPGRRHFDDPDFKPHVRVGSVRHLEAFRRLQASDLDFGAFSPAKSIAPGERTGKFQMGVGKLLRDAKGESFVSAEDYAVAMLDEVENPQYIRQNFTIAY
jgi:putative NADH-flavin reductase